MDNPAFEGSAGSGSGETNDTSTDGGSASGTNSGEAGSASASASGTNTDSDTNMTDPPETGMEAEAEAEAPSEGPEPDLGPPPCVPNTNEGFWPQYGSPDDFDEGCANDVYQHVKIYKGFEGDWEATLCSNSCTGCGGQPIIIAAHDLSLAMLIEPTPYNPDNADTAGCYVVEANELLSNPGDSTCIYGSLSVHEPGEGVGPLLFHVNREGWGLTEQAGLLFDNWAPDVVPDDNVPPCACDNTENIDCCEGKDIVAKKFHFGPQQFVYPGGSDDPGVGEVSIQDNNPFEFYAAQAQSGMVCGLNDQEWDQTSWALYRD